MKKIFTLALLLVASTGLVEAHQVTVSWPLYNLPEGGSIERNDKGESSSSKITVSDMTYGSGFHTLKPKSYNEGKGILFSPTSGDEHTTPLTDGSQSVTLSFTVPVGYYFTPTSVTFFSAADGSGNIHLLDFTIKNGDTNVNVTEGYQLGRGSSDAKVKTETIADTYELEGEVSVVIDLYGKPGSTSKGWALGDIVVTGDLVNKSDTRDNADISWDKNSVSLKVRDTFVSPKLINGENLAVVFSSSNEEVATVDVAGVISLVEGGIGTAIISAAYDGDAEGAKYKSTTVSTTIEVLSNVFDEDVQMKYDTMEHLVLDKSFKPTKSSGSTTANNKLISDNHINAVTVFAPKYGSYTGNYFGNEYTCCIQLGRVKAVPTEAVKTGTEDSGNSPLEITAKKNCHFVVMFRRQTVEQEGEMTVKDDVEKNIITRTHYMGMSPNDGKSLHLVDQNNISKVLDQTLIFGEYCDDGTSTGYLNCAAIWELEEGHTYTLYAHNTTISVHEFGYISHDVTSADHGEKDINLSVDKDSYTVTLTPALAHHHIYYKYESIKNTPVAVLSRAVDDDIHAGYTKLEADSNGNYTYTVDKNDTGLLKYYSYDPITNKKGAVQTLAFNDTSTGIENVAVDGAEAEAEYYNLQGQRVLNPEKGNLYIVKRDGKATKVVL